MISPQQRESEMREQYPHMFTHPGLRPGEVWIGDQAYEFAMINSHMHRTKSGMPSTRLVEETVMVPVMVNDKLEDCPGHSMFVKLSELIAAIEKDEREHPEE